MKKLLLVLAAVLLVFPVHASSTFYTNSTTGNVGVGTTTPQSLLQVYGGEVQVGSSAAACSATNAGALRYASGSAYVCDSSAWDVIGGSAGGTLPALTSAHLWVGNGSNVATAVALSGDCTISNAGAITCTKTNGVAFGTLATQYGVNLSTQATGTLQAAQEPAHTGDVTNTAGSLAMTVAAIQGTTVSGTTGSGNVVFSASPTLTGTVTAGSSIWSGYVGIGTTSPSTPLNLVTSLSVSGSEVAFEYDNSGVMRTQIFSDGGQYWNLNTGSGEVGQIQYSTPGGLPGIVFFNSSGTGRSQFQQLTSTGGLGFGAGTGSINPGTQMVLTTAGYVGIGTTTPTTALQVNGTVTATTFSGSGASLTSIGTSNMTVVTGAPSSTTYLSGDGTWSTPPGDGTVTSSSAGQVAYYQSTGTAVIGTSSMVISSGNVGIGTTSPLSLFSVGSGSAFQVNNAGDVTVTGGGDQQWGVYWGDGTNILNWNESTKALSVYGTLTVGTFASASSTTVCQSSNVLSTCSSARRYKGNIKPSGLGLKEVLAMNPVTFDFKGHKDNWEKHDFGFVAEDMEKIDPLFVTYDDKGDVEGVRYMQLTAVNAKAIQELHGIIAGQQAAITKQQDEIDELKQTVARLARPK